MHFSNWKFLCALLRHHNKSWQQQNYWNCLRWTGVFNRWTGIWNGMGWNGNGMEWWKWRVIYSYYTYIYITPLWRMWTPFFVHSLVDRLYIICHGIAIIIPQFYILMWNLRCCFHHTLTTICQLLHHWLHCIYYCKSNCWGRVQNPERNRMEPEVIVAQYGRGHRICYGKLVLLRQASQWMPLCTEKQVCAAAYSLTRNVCIQYSPQSNMD